MQTAKDESAAELDEIIRQSESVCGSWRASAHFAGYRIVLDPDEVIVLLAEVRKAIGRSRVRTDTAEYLSETLADCIREINDDLLDDLPADTGPDFPHEVVRDGH
jgi:uncharacterized protein YacL (UPF0231 family)